MEGEIRLYTKSGWEYTTSLTPSSPFFDFLLGMQEATGDLPDEIELTGSVAEIVEKKWEAYSRMKRRETVKLHELSRISRILTMPEGWRKNVAVTRESSQEERLTHFRESPHKGMQRGSFEANILSEIWSTLDESYSSQIGSIHHNKMKMCGNWSDVLWEDIPLLITGADIEPRTRSTIVNTCELLLGRGSPHAECVEVEDDMFFVGPDNLTLPSRMDLLYDRILAAYPADESPIGLGLEPILNGGKVNLTHNYNNGCNEGNIRLEGIVPWLNFNTLLFHLRHPTRDYTNTWASLNYHHFSLVIELLDVSTVGRKGLIRILHCLEAYATKSKKKNKRVDHFITLTRERIETVPDPIERLPLDTSNEVIANILKRRR